MKIQFTATSKKEFKKLPKNGQKKIARALKKLARFPFLGKKLSGKLKGYYSLKVWPYRIIYEFLSRKLIVIDHLGHRKDIYKA